MFVSMQLESYITDLLYRNECVIIPGFGAFLTQTEPVRFDAVPNTFYPPKKRLMFNERLQTNDGILANYVASIENCNYTLALQKIRNFTANLSLKLAQGNTVVFKNIGSFYLNNEASIQFAPSEKENFDTSSFGLAPITYSSIERTVSTLEVTKEKVLGKSKYPFLKYAAAIAGLILVSSVVVKEYYNSAVEKHNYTAKQQAESLIENDIQEATFVIENPLPSLHLTANKNTGRYHIVAGAFRNKKNVVKKITQLSLQGYHARMIGVNKYGLHQVVYSSHDSRKEAKQVLSSIKKNLNKDAWMLTLDVK